MRIIGVLSVTIVAAVAFLILGPRPEGLSGQLDVSALPAVNAGLNLITTVLLVSAFALIKAKKIELHKRVMLTAFGTSTLFLITYVVYHWFKTGPKPYTGEWVMTYRFILLTHIVLAAGIVPMALVTLFRGWHMQVQRHRAIAKIALPLWLYVSVTGVLIYWMLY